MSIFEQIPPQQEKHSVWQKKAWKESLDFHITTQDPERRKFCTEYFSYLERVVSDEENWVGEGGGSTSISYG